MAQLQREERLCLSMVGDHAYDVTNQDGDLVYHSSDDFFIYFKHAVFNEDGSIEGRYLGECDEKIFSGYSRKTRYTEDDGWIIEPYISGIGKARMVAVENKTQTVIIIREEN